MQGPGFKALVNNFSATFARQIAAAMLQLATIVIIARAFGPEMNGAYVVALLLPGILATFLNLGITPANVYYLSSRQVTISVLVQANLQLYMLLVATGSAAGATLLYFKGTSLFSGVDQEALWLAMAAFPLNMLQNLLMSIFQGLQLFRLFNLVLLVQPMLMLAMAGLLAVFGIRSILLLVGVNIFSSLVVIILALSQLKPMLVGSATMPWSRGSRDRHQTRKYLRQALGYGWKAHLGSMLQFVNYKADILLVNMFAGPAFAGVYAVALTLVEKLWIASQAVSTVLLPRLSQLSADEETRKVITPIVSRWVLMATAMGGGVIAAVSYPLIVFVFGADYVGAVLPTLLLLPGVVLFSAARVLANDIASRGRPELNMYVSAATVVINLAGNLALIPRYGLVGAAIATTTAYSLTLVLTLVLYARFTSNSWRDSVFLKSNDIRMARSVLARP